MISLAPLRATALAVATAVVVATLTACSIAEPGGSGAGTPPPAAATATTSAGTDSDLPVPGSTLPASAVDAAGAVPAGLRVSVIAVASRSAGEADMGAARGEVQAFADAHDAIVTVVDPEDESAVDADALLRSALDEEADVIVVLGGSLASALDRVSAANLGQQYLMLGAQLPEPTENVTAVIWPGADARGGEDAPAVLAARIEEALDAGVAAVLARNTGIVVALP